MHAHEYGLICFDRWTLVFVMDSRPAVSDLDRREALKSLVFNLRVVHCPPSW